MQIILRKQYCLQFKGKKTKKPVAAGDGATGTNNNYQKTWVTYDEAISAKQHMKADDIDLVILVEYFFLDIDYQELISPFVQMMLKRFSSYAEISPSGNGLHIYGIHMLISIPPKYSVAQVMGYLKRKSSLMIFDRHANLKYKYGNRHFWCRGYYVDTVGKNKKRIEEYIRNQLQDDIANDQLSLFELVDPFTGKKNSKK